MPPDSRDAPDRRRVLVGLMLAMALAAMDATIVATAIPSIVRDLGGFSLFAWVFSAYVLMQAVTIPVYGKLVDLYGRKPVLVAGMLVFLAGSALSGAAWSMPALIVFRGLQGVGAGAIQPVVTTIAGDLYTVEERARVQGWISSVWAMSAVVGPAIGGLLAQYATWRWIFYVNVPLGVAALAVVPARLYEPAVPRPSHRPDALGAALLMAGTGLAIFGLLQGGVRWAWGSGPSVGTFVGAAALLVAFGVTERRVAEPMLPPWVFGRRLLLGAALAAACVGLLMIGLTTFLPTFAQGVLGASPVAAGFALAAMSVGWPLASASSGRLYLRIGFRDTGLVGATVALGAAVALVAMGGGSRLWQATAASFVLGLGLGLLATPLIVGVQSVVDWGRRGVATGASLFARMLGQALGAAIFGSVANSALGHWIASAPPSLRARLPRSVNAASSVLGGHPARGPAAAYLRHGLDLATHRVFLGLVAVAAVLLLVLVSMPRRFEKLRFELERPVTPASEGGRQ